ncbi:MAG: hypothetical protein COB98_07015 [Flavobacteriaceae bacterium]|nr:MAG: hypothetical protein COB98_07015 [Flavobacteriaceae bacterium]
MKLKKPMYWSLLIIGLITLTSGHHFETKLAKDFPMYDMTDVYCFPSSNAGMTTFILDFNPEASTDSTFYKNFGNKKGYRQLHIGYDKGLDKGVSLGFSFSANKIKIYSTQSANPSLGELGKKIGKGKINEIISLKNGITVWSGIVKDPFNGNGAALYGKMKEAVKRGEWDDKAFASDKGNDSFKNSQVVAIVIDVPNTMLGDKIYYHASSVAKLKGTEKGHKHAHWHRINRIAHVLLPHLYMETMSDRDRQNAGNISDDNTRRKNCVDMLEKYSRLSKSQADPKAYALKMTELLLPDHIPYIVGTPASYTLPVINGRSLSDNAMDTALEILVGKPFPNYTDVKTADFTTKFPYLKAVK